MRKKENKSLREKILEIAQQKFFSDGFVKTSIDEIAKEYHISKKTIYKYFKSKDDLLSNVVKYFASQVTNSVIEIMSSDKNSIQKLIDVLNLVQNSIKQLSMKYIDDIQKHKPRLWNYIEKIRRENLEKVVTQTIEAGKEQGLFENVDPEIVFRIFYGAVRNVLNPEFLITNPISSEDAIKKTFDILLNGILTKDGRKLYKRQNKGL